MSSYFFQYNAHYIDKATCLYNNSHSYSIYRNQSIIWNIDNHFRIWYFNNWVDGRKQKLRRVSKEYCSLMELKGGDAKKDQLLRYFLPGFSGGDRYKFAPVTH